jgi:1-acyl-sn-glycerol-3-phosphate acyltransferase
MLSNSPLEPPVPEEPSPLRGTEKQTLWQGNGQPPPYRFGWFDRFCAWYPPGWLILFNRHWQHYHPDPDGWSWLEYPLFLIPGGFYLALLIRWLRLGCRAPRRMQVTIDVFYQEAFQTEVLSYLVQRHFQAELLQMENLPTSTPLIVALNHAGMCFPWDFVSLGVLLKQVRGWVVRPLAHEIFFDHPWLRWWLPAGWSQVLGGIRATREGLSTAVQEENLVLLYAPEGWRGLVKGWPDRHQLANFDPSFIDQSDRHQIPILPVVCLGNESLHPWAIHLRGLANRLGLPIFPLSPLMPLFLLFPSLGVWAMKTHLRYVIQPMVPPQPENAGQRRSHLYQRAQQVRSMMQAVLEGRSLPQ